MRVEDKKRLTRSSNIELFRIIIMLIIVAHHYVINSGLLTIVETQQNLKFRDVFLLIFGWGGKTGINCFVLITGYFMCTSNITVRKFCKLIGERYFYSIVIWGVFLVVGYEIFSMKMFLKVIFPFFSVTNNFTGCFLLFYLFIPFLNLLIDAINEKQHLSLIGLCVFVYTILPSIFKADVSFNYVTWFIVLYFIAAYLRLYPKRWFNNRKLWGVLSVASLIVSWLSVIVFAYLGIKLEKPGIEYFEVADSNKLLAVVTAVSLFMFFKNLKIKNSKFINTIAASTFGVFLIHTNSDTMRKFLWEDFFKNTSFYNSPYLIVHAIGTVIIVYSVCTLIDWLRIQLFAKIKKVREWFVEEK